MGANESEGRDQVSETENEQPDAEPTEPTTEPAPAGDDEAEAEEAEQEGAEPVEPSEAEPSGDAAAQPEPAALTEKEIEARIKKLDTLRDNTAKRVSDILGEDAIAYRPCPLCADGVVGHVPDVAGGGAVPDEVFAAVQRYLGLPDPDTFSNHPNFKRCEACKGRGEVITGSSVPNYMLTGCPECGTKGYIVDGQLPVPGATNGTTEPAPVITGPTAPDNLPPEAVRLKELGYMIVPPMQPTPGLS